MYAQDEGAVFGKVLVEKVEDTVLKVGVEIDDDVREEYWSKIRNLPENKNIKIINGK